MTDSVDDTRPPRLCLLLIGDSGRRITTYSSPVAPGRWYFVAARYDPNTNARLTVLSLDGRRADTIDAATIARNTNSTDTASGSIHYATGDGQVTRLGLSPSESAHQWAYRGRLDEVVFYNQSLTNEQLARLVAAWIDPGRADSHVPITSRIKEKEAHP
jgi:hypothetical protein